MSLLADSLSGSTKDRWNASHYVQVKISTKPETAASFKAACAAADVSIASVLSKFMTEYSQNNGASGHNGANGSRQAPRLCRTCYKANLDVSPFSTRRKRRAAIKAIISQIEQIAAAEKTSRDNIPKNLQESDVYEASDESLGLLVEVKDLLADIY